MTPATQKEMPANFNFQEEESRLYEWWEENGWFKPEHAPEDAETFTISMPPPNVTGVLHLGHALFASLQDLMIRYERMRGKAALWVPGTDHAGIATQLQVEKMLREEGTSRHDIGRDAFLERTWAWKEEKGGTIVEQLRRIGASCDWDRERFTLDEGLSEAVQEVFVRLWEQGRIYRGPRLVNWSPGLQTAVSDLEVERAEEQGKLYFFNYPLEGDESIAVATTRPETILGDTAICVHPEDERYQHLIGKTAYVPMLNREIPVIADEYVDREFGTGAVKITPAHDFNDYDIAQRHDLEMINIMNKDATLNENAGPYAGMDRFDARQKLWADMEAAGMTIKVQDHTMVVPRSQRGGEVVEPLLSTQWFVKMDDIAERALEAVRTGAIKIVPERFTKVYYHWLENIQDWCVSRQLWWGHRIPAWFREKDGDPEGEIYVGRTAPEGDGWVPEEDVLDTWFSSGLWPFSTLGWPQETPDLKRFYPTQVMETGHDILFFWVARMIMMGMWFTEEPPFDTVYLHGLVRDKTGRKFSKTLGNVIDPLLLIDQYGADPLRFTLLTSGTPGNDVNLDEARVEYTFKFVNKIWNITKLVNMNLEGELEPGLPNQSELDLPSRWVISRTQKLIDNVQYLFDAYQYGEAGNQILSFMWDEFAPWYLEMAKHPLYNGTEAEQNQTRRVMVYVLDTCLRLLHPYMPYMTESAWQYIPHEEDALIVAKWPISDKQLVDEAAETNMGIFMSLVRDIRNIRTDYNVDPGKRISAEIKPGSYRKQLEDYGYIFGRLCNVPDVSLMSDDAAAPENAASTVVNDITLYLPLEGMLDIAAECERLQKEQAKIADRISGVEKKLANEGFVSKAPEQVVQRERERLEQLQAESAQIAEQISNLCG
ncbi:valine--tRNA ligase [Phototrophicus methaneseepsis]|uniref:Valine--tRNA ligase n=1 Tax=Phototrophicus methaneseepsis TaxID=2710758 RepID=A0A7S8E5Y1_9CHLR|nr:valine--tRNA ligase [Phototrophicus methaneseepsis]QPC80981.1 valine--tRNA ligase [Phototrophicus methaneseepsis]